MAFTSITSIRAVSLATLAALAFMLAACPKSPDAPVTAQPTPSPAPEPAALCASTDCGSKTVLLTIPDAENSLFTPDGRLFVSGGLNVYEIVGDETEGFDAIPLFNGECNFTGLAQRGDVLYATCGGTGELMAATIDDAPALTPIYMLSGMTLANGTADGPDGRLYIADGPTTTDPKIVQISFDPNDPFTVTDQQTWLSDGLQFPNGVDRLGDTLYITDGSVGIGGATYSVKSVQINVDGSPGTVTTLHSQTTVFDDLTVFDQGILVSDFALGAIYLLDPDGNLLQQTNPGTFQSASSVRLGQPPLFAPTDILVTEKGTIGDTGSNLGNVLSVFRAH